MSHTHARTHARLKNVGFSFGAVISPGPSGISQDTCEMKAVNVPHAFRLPRVIPALVE